MNLEIRTYQPGDEVTQAAIYNAVAANLPGFKPALLPDLQRRTSDPAFEAGTRFYAMSGGQIVGYCMIQPSGRIGYPWSLPGHGAEEPLFDAAVETCRSRGLKRLISAYRADWTAQSAFFESHGFRKARDMINFAQNLLDLPTMVIRRGLNISPLKADDLPAMAALAPTVLTIPLEKMEQFFLANRYFSADSLFVLRKTDGTVQGVGALISNGEYAHPLQVDSAAPCFRLGAFGTEEMTTKRIKGLFSFLVRDDTDGTAIGLDLLSYSLNLLQDDSIDVLAAQAPSDAKHLVSFYQKYFRKQGSFPVFERELT
jgi:GNAT superfamily N-acetyltransferase